MLKCILLLASITLAQVVATSDHDIVDSFPSSATYDCSGPSSTSESFIDYDHLVHCNSLLQSSPELGKAALVLCLVLLLYLLSSTADEFFCPVLQAIVEKYRIPPHVAGVTFLSFGNGSPDVFSNIAAFATPTPSIGVTSILGGGLLVTTVITACVGLASAGHEQLIPRTFLRDVIFYFLAVLYLGMVFFDGQVELPEAVGFLFIYFVYVLVVFSDKYLAAYCFPCKVHTEDLMYSVLDDEEDIQHCPSSTASEKSSAITLLSFPVHVEQTQEQQKRRPYFKSQTIPVYETFVRTQIFSDSEQSEPSPRFLDRMQYRKNSVPTPRSIPCIIDEFGPLRRDEGQSLLEVTDVHLKRPTSMCVASMQESLRRMRRQRRRRKTAWESLESSAHFGTMARRWTRGYHALSDIDEFSSFLELFGDVGTDSEENSEMSEEEVIGKELEAILLAAENEQFALEAIMAVSSIDYAKVKAKRCWRLTVRSVRCVYRSIVRVVWNPFAVFTVFVRRLTIPLVDEDTWDKNLVVVCPPFAMLLFGISVFSFSIEDPVFLMSVVVAGGTMSCILEHTTSPLAPPEGLFLAPFLGVAFIMSIIWIMNIANEVLTLLETLGALFGIPSSVLGVSVLAWGNSIGDLVSNMAIARDGFPTMAFAGCFAGPMFNLLVGIGLSLTIAIISRGPITMAKPSPLAYLGFGYLLLSLLLNIVIASYDGFRYRPQLCYTLLALYASFAVLSIALVIHYPDE
ncbi:unnamed protein product [Peronospora farinosa]|uniref:Sodium/calcium exchanger membrane region domain-containing protein n=1 Tax=Peronospora farinosa TaxID=134698 RepID=A0AAV0T317_9STRA|nr:unnamed protein product [Peronospora farinosa]CAI5712934.1 unnamed protein product [Peronospora farinosa]